MLRRLWQGWWLVPAWIALMVAALMAYGVGLVSRAVRCGWGCLARHSRAVTAADQRTAPVAGGDGHATTSPLSSPRHAYAVEALMVDGVPMPSELIHFQPTAAPTPTIGGAPGTPRVFVMFPGNPGSALFYTTFLAAVAEADPTAHVYGVGHPGHSAATLTAQGHVYNLRDQVEHKVALLSRILHPRHPDAQWHIAGHSVGAYMAMRCVARMPPSFRVGGVYYLFPTLSNIGASPNGVRLTPFFNHMRPAAAWFTHAVTHLPRRWQRAVLSWFMPHADEASLGAAMTLLHPHVATNALTLAAHEMQEIKHLLHDEFQAVARASGSVVAYFAEEDDWVHETDKAELQRSWHGRHNVQVQVCKQGHRHAFVLNAHSATCMAHAVARWMLSTPASHGKGRVHDPSRSRSPHAARTPTTRDHRSSTSRSPRRAMPSPWSRTGPVGKTT